MIAHEFAHAFLRIRGFSCLRLICASLSGSITASIKYNSFVVRARPHTSFRAEPEFEPAVEKDSSRPNFIKAPSRCCKTVHWLKFAQLQAGSSKQNTCRNFDRRKTCSTITHCQHRNDCLRRSGSLCDLRSSLLLQNKRHRRQGCRC